MKGATVGYGKRRGALKAGGAAAAAEATSVAFFFLLDLLEEFLSRLTFYAELGKRDRFQPALADFNPAIGANPISPFGQPRKGFVDGLAPAIANLHQGDAEFPIQIYESLIANIAGGFESPLLILSQ